MNRSDRLFIADSSDLSRVEASQPHWQPLSSLALHHSSLDKQWVLSQWVSADAARARAIVQDLPPHQYPRARSALTE